MVPNSPGGGYDITARTAAKVMEDDDIATGTEVFNLEGAGGTVGLARTVNEKGNGDLAMMMGLGVVGASYTNKSEATLTDTTPIARLIEEPGAVMVPRTRRTRPSTTWSTAWKADPAGISVGGGSSPGGPDHLLPMQLAQAVGIDPKEVNYVSVRRRRRPAARPARRQGRLRHLRAPASSRTRSRTARSGCWRPAARSASTASTRPRSRSPASTWCSPTGAASWPLRASPTPTSAELIAAFEEMHDTAGVEGRAEGEQLDRRVRHRRRVRRLPRASRTSGSPTSLSELGLA